MNFTYNSSGSLSSLEKPSIQNFFLVSIKKKTYSSTSSGENFGFNIPTGRVYDSLYDSEDMQIYNILKYYYAALTVWFIKPNVSNHSIMVFNYKPFVSFLYSYAHGPTNAKVGNAWDMHVEKEHF